MLPLQKEILRMHVLILALPFLTLIAWALFGEAYQSITIVLLMGLFYLLPRKVPKDGSETKADSNQGVQAPGVMPLVIDDKNPPYKVH